MDIAKLLQTVYKIKATLKVLMAGGDQEMVRKIKSVFRNDMRISKHPTENEFDFFLENGSLQSEVNKTRNDRLKRNAFDSLKKGGRPGETEPPKSEPHDKAQQKQVSETEDEPPNNDLEELLIPADIISEAKQI